LVILRYSRRQVSVVIYGQNLITVHRSNSSF
jgi:hypothetical protein